MTDSINQFAHYLRAMEIDIWVLRQPVAGTPIDTPEIVSTDSSVSVTTTTSDLVPAIALPVPESDRTDEWKTLQNQVIQCTACELYKTRTQTVFGVGDQQARCVFVGEAPGADEDAQGEPFVGRAGKLLNAMLFTIQVPRESVYIANVLKCRPPDNRNPAQHEMVCCTPFLRQQIALIQPKLIVALGAIAAQYLLSTKTAIGSLRGKRFEYADTGIPLIATYHPAYLLRSPLQKRKAWEDLQLIHKMMTEQD
jgi:DNA polymerase